MRTDDTRRPVPGHKQSPVQAHPPSPFSLSTHRLWPKADPGSLQPLHKESALWLDRAGLDLSLVNLFLESQPLPAALQARLPNMGLEGWPRRPARHGPWQNASPGSVPSASWGAEGPMLAPCGGGQFSQETLQGREVVLTMLDPCRARVTQRLVRLLDRLVPHGRW